MPSQPGETCMITVFADVHYYFSPPDQQPLHHRFQRGSYVYIYQNPASGQRRLEIANNPGTPEQDAVAGSLENAEISHSFKHPTLLNVTVKTNASSGTQQWQLPAFDLRNERKYLYPLNSIDLYFWTLEDAQDVLSSLKKIRTIGSLDVQGSSTSQGNKAGGINPVIQKLEQAAIGTPFQHTQTASTSTTRSVASVPVPGSPEPVASPGQASGDPAASYVPLAYNPSAPARPEPISVREKTPPPEDLDSGTPFNTSSPAKDGIYASPSQHPQMQYPYTNQQQHHPQSYFSLPPQQPAMFSPPPTQHSTFFPPPPPQVPATPQFSAPPRTLSFPPPPPQDRQQHTQSFSPPPIDITPHPTAFPSQTAPAPPQTYHPTPNNSTHPQSPSSYPQQPQPQVPAFSQPPLQSPPYASPSSQQYFPSASQHLPNAYTTTTNITPSTTDPYAIHAQVYRPVPTDAGSENGKAAVGQQQAAGRLEARADRLEKGVNRFLKRLDKKF